MNAIPVPDFGWAAFATMVGSAALLYGIPVTILVETYIIKAFLSLSFQRSLLDAILMNVASGALGAVALSLEGPRYQDPAFLESFGASYYESTPEAIRYLLLSLMGTHCLISIIVEGLVLSLMESKSPRSVIWLVSLFSNMISYLGLFVIALSLVTK